MRKKLAATVTRVVDGDTIRVNHAHAQADEALRILALDTEESHPGSNKPVTPWGGRAKDEAEQFFSVGDTVQLEFPGAEPIDVCLDKYRGNFGRLLVFVSNAQGKDFQQHMIRLGYSPYFTKYGYAPGELHARYDAAEREAQEKHTGVWNQLEVNGSEVRNYAALGTLWRLRGEVVQSYRGIQGNDDLLNSRLDYQKIVERASTGDNVVVFTELRSLQRVGQKSAVILIGSQHQPFSIFLPDIESDTGQRIVQLLRNRYISSDVTHPRRSYAYVSGGLSLFNEQPQIKVISQSQITDHAP